MSCAEPGKGKGAERYFNVAHGDVKELPLDEQAERDGPQPQHEDVRRIAGEAGEHGDADDDLDDAHDMHEGGGRDMQQAWNGGMQVHLPVRKPIEELVESGEDGSQAEPDAERPPRRAKLWIKCHDDLLLNGAPGEHSVTAEAVS
jgi:hypothetical protein